MNIDKNTYKIDKKNFYKTLYDKKQIILAGSLRKENYHIKRLQKKEYGQTKTWPTYSISREGEIFQHYDPKYYTDFMGIKDVDKHAISIVLENMGVLFYDQDSDKFLNWLYEECNEDKIFERKWKKYRYWEQYTNVQFNSVIELCEYLCEKYYIELDCLGFNVHHEKTNNFEGIVTRSNYDVDFNDLNPSFNFREFLEKLEIDYIK